MLSGSEVGFRMERPRAPDGHSMGTIMVRFEGDIQRPVSKSGRGADESWPGPRTTTPNFKGAHYPHHGSGMAGVASLGHLDRAATALESDKQPLTCGGLAGICDTE